jgi:hypothetical protein
VLQLKFDFVVLFTKVVIVFQWNNSSITLVLTFVIYYLFHKLYCSDGMASKLRGWNEEYYKMKNVIIIYSGKLKGFSFEDVCMDEYY